MSGRSGSGEFGAGGREVFRGDAGSAAHGQLLGAQGDAVAQIDRRLAAGLGGAQRGDRIELRGFGVFQVKPRKRGIGRNPRTGKEVRIPPGRTIRFKPGKELQNIS